jgi:hypothetical protein
MAELDIEGTNRLRNIAQASFARGGQGFDEDTLASFEKGRLGAKQLAKQKSLSEARKAKFEQDTLAETERSNKAQEVLKQSTLDETTRSNKLDEEIRTQQNAILQLKNDLAAAKAYDERRAAEKAAKAQQSSLEKIGSAIWSFFGW